MDTALREWVTAGELADFALAGMPRSKREVNRLAEAQNWAVAVDQRGAPLARRRAGRGGGTEYHVSLLPAQARIALALRDADIDPGATDAPGGSAGLWQWYARQATSVREEAERRRSIVAKVDLFANAGMTRSSAVDAAAKASGTGASTLWTWMKMIEGVPLSDRLPLLAPRRSGGGKEADVNPEIWQALISDFLRFSKPSWATCIRRTAEPLAKERGIALPHARTLWRKFEREVPAQVVTMRRDGEEALRRMMPAQTRSVAGMEAMELVNIDGHRCDVFVRWPDGRIIRPMMIAIQDIYSRRFLSWRHAENEDMVTARLVFADLFRDWGIPAGLLADNGRAFASKWLTGGAKTRFRFKVRDEDPTGLLTALGITIHWAKPYRGQSKPIERGFRDLCDAVAKHPAFDGAYTGNSPTAKPEDYATRAIDLDVFLRVWNAGMAAHNAQVGRRSEMARGKLSFDQVFSESYAKAAIGKASDEQLRMALLAADQVRCNRQNGSVTIAGNTYWTPQLVELTGQLVTVRFDPENLHSPVHIYDQAGRYLLTAPVQAAVGFSDMAAARDRAKMERDWKKAEKAADAALDRLSAADLVAKLSQYEEDEELPPAATVQRIVRHRGQTAAALKPASVVAESPLQTPDTSASIAAATRIAAAAERRLRLVE